MSKEVLTNLKAKFGDRVDIVERSGRRAYVTVASGSDRSTGVELLYHFAIDRDGTVVNIRTTLSKPFPKIESLTPYYPCADFIEREIYDFLGVEFVGHPDPRKILSSPDRPADFHPMRRDE